METWKADLKKDPDQRFSQVLLERFYRHRDFFLSLYRSHLSWMLHDHLNDFCGLNSTLPPVAAYAIAAIAGALFGWVDEWISRGMLETPAELIKLGNACPNTESM